MVTVEDHLRDKPEASVALFHRFVELVQECGPFTYSPSKTTVTVKGARRGFAGASPTPKGLRGYFDLQRHVTGRQILSSAPYTKRLFVHQYRVSSPDELDDEFAGWVREAYLVGQGAHLESPAVTHQGVPGREIGDVT